MEPSASKKLLDRYDPGYENKIRREYNQKRFILLFLVLPAAPPILLSASFGRSKRQLNDSEEVNSTLLKYGSGRNGSLFSSLSVAKKRYHIEVFQNNSLMMNYLLIFVRLGLTLASSANQRRKERRQHQNGG